MAEKKPTKAEQENEELRNQLASMQSLIMELQAKIGMTAPEVKDKKDKTIKFVNLSTGTLVLRGTHIYKIDGQFKSRSFTEKEAMIILNNMPETLTNGMVYIADADFVKENDLADSYETMIDDKQMKKLLSQDASMVIDMYKNASETQKEIIINMITDKKQHDINVDNNVLVELGKLSGKDLINVERLDEDKM